MQATARARYLRGSARKMRQVANLIRGRSVHDALQMLAVMPHAATEPLRKTVMSATANALASEGTAHLKSEDLRISRILVDGGPAMKRIRPMGMGRAYRIRKQLCHLTVVVEGEHEEAAKSTPARSSARKPARKTAAAKRSTRAEKTRASSSGRKSAKKRSAAKGES